MPGPSVHYLSHGYPTGYGVAGWRLALALVEVGVDLRWTPLDFHPATPAFAPSRPSHPVLDQHRGPVGRPDVVVLHAIPEVIPAIERATDGAPLVCHTVWEADRLQPHWPELLNRCTGVIVPTDWNAEVFRDSGVTVPIEVVPHAREQDGLPADQRWLTDADDRFVVATIAEWEERKAPWRTVEAYAKAFQPDDDVLLVLKTGRRVQTSAPRFRGPPGRDGQTSWALAMLLRELGRTPPLLIVDRLVSDAEVRGLHERADCWLSLPHGEGWDLGVFDAAISGTPVITTGWGAPAEYLDADACHLVPGPLVPARYDVTAPDHGMRWCDPDLDEAVEALRWVHGHQRAARRRARRQRAALRARCAPTAVATAFVAALERLVR